MIIIHTEASAGYGFNVVQSSWSGTSSFRRERATHPSGWMTEAAARSW